MEQSGSDRTVLTVGGWLLLFDAANREWESALVESVADAAKGLLWHDDDREEAIDEATVRALHDNAAALRRAQLKTPLAGFLRGMLVHIRQERRRSQRRREVDISLAGTSEARSSPPSQALESNEDLRLDMDVVLMAIPDLSSPRGLVLYLQIVRGLSHAGIHRVLERLRPVGRERVDGFIREAHGEFRAWLAGKDPRRLWPRRFSSSRNPWCSPTPLPPRKSRSS